ncbi:MAG: hypothetical protein R3B89_33435 [Polyangiaceae bacterium]
MKKELLGCTILTLVAVGPLLACKQEEAETHEEEPAVAATPSTADAPVVPTPPSAELPSGNDLGDTSKKKKYTPAEDAAFWDAFCTLWEPKNADAEEATLFQQVARRHRMKASAVQALYLARQDETTHLLGSTEQRSEPAPLWWTPRKGLLSSEVHQCHKEDHVQIRSRKTPSAAC